MSLRVKARVLPGASKARSEPVASGTLCPPSQAASRGCRVFSEIYTPCGFFWLVLSSHLVREAFQLLPLALRLNVAPLLGPLCPALLISLPTSYSLVLLGCLSPPAGIEAPRWQGPVYVRFAAQFSPYAGVSGVLLLQAFPLVPAPPLR